MIKPDPLRVLHIAAEADPFVKIGGLGDVIGSLPAAIRDLQSMADPGTGDLDIRVAIPFHGAISRSAYTLQHVTNFTVSHTSGPIYADAYSTSSNGITFYLIAGNPISPTAPVYSSDLGYDAHKYIFFSLAALELARKLDWRPHIVHAHDWHTAPAIYWLSRQRDTDTFFQQTATLLTVHNLPFMGAGASFPMASYYLPPAVDTRLPDWARQLPLPLGLLTADHITAVSPTYGHEILTPEFGAGLESFLQARSTSISGILNGLDTQRWDPNSDPHLSVNFSASNFSLREANKIALLSELGFITENASGSEADIPLIVMIGRMDYQKGVDLTIGALQLLATQSSTSLPWRAIILGTGLVDLEQSARRLENKYPQQIRVATRFDAPLSHRLYAGADILLTPSRYEPCGLAQLIAMRYGCIPVARATGGLKDTVIDCDESEFGTGFIFKEASIIGLAHCLKRALDHYQDKISWKALQQRSMQQDHSWQKSAREYLQLYYDLSESRVNR